MAADWATHEGSSSDLRHSVTVDALGEIRQDLISPVAARERIAVAVRRQQHEIPGSEVRDHTGPEILGRPRRTEARREVADQPAVLGDRGNAATVDQGDDVPIADLCTPQAVRSQPREQQVQP